MIARILFLFFILITRMYATTIMQRFESSFSLVENFTKSTNSVGSNFAEVFDFSKYLDDEHNWGVEYNITGGRIQIKQTINEIKRKRKRVHIYSCNFNRCRYSRIC